ncbi:MAG: dTDP-glucose 4,6-dehydratase [Bdellovibrionales bacterium]|nr:dTDP-glucose 4,6-dehydratase [Bdellovibrionales bacterium]
MNILVTGGAGFIGSNLVYSLHDRCPDWNITVVDALTYAGNLHNIASLVDTGKVAFSKCDIADATSVHALFEEKQFEMVFHLAAESHVDRSIHSASEFVRTNVLGTQTLLDASLAIGVKRFMHISTDEVYGSLGPTGKFTEQTPLDPTSPYAASKAASDLLVEAFHKTHGLDAIITRCTNNYGPYQFPEKFIPLFISNAMEDKPLPLYGDGMNVRSWLYVTDHCDALYLLSQKGVAGEAYNIGGDDAAEIPNKIVAEAICSSLGKSSDLIQYVTDRLAHDRRYAVDFSKIHQAVGWEPSVPFEDGLLRTIAWYQEHRSWWEEIKSGEYRDYYQRHYSGR